MRIRALTRPWWFAVVVGLTALPRVAPAEKTWTPAQEKRAGDEALAEISRETQPWDNTEQLARCQRIADAIAPRTGRPDVKYQVRLIQIPPSPTASSSGTANAVSLPGGSICVTRGLLDPSVGSEAAYLAVQSDDELAGVLAHEIAHNCLYHGLKQADRNQKYLRGGLVAALVGLVLGGTPASAFGALGMANYVRMGVLSHYSVEYEVEADTHAVAYLVQTPHSPVGLLTFMERLAAEERSRVHVELGIAQTHPYPVERVQMLRRAIVARGVDINRRGVTTWKRAEALEAVENGTPAWVAMLWDRPIYTFRATSPAGQTPEQRATAAVQCLNDALAAGMAEFDISVARDATGPRVTLLGRPLLSVLPGDLDDPKYSPDDAAQAVVHALRVALFSDTLNRQIKPR